MYDREAPFEELRRRLSDVSDHDPIPWYARAERVCKSFSAITRGKPGSKSHVYAVLLQGVDGKRPGYALYVGRTSHEPAVRFQQHKDGYKASRHVKKYGLRLLPALYQHLNPMSNAESIDLEIRIAAALEQAGVPTFGGH